MAEVREVARLLEAVRCLIDSKADVGFVGGVGLKKGKEIKARENVR